jgi:hypothetical protein
VLGDVFQDHGFADAVGTDKDGVVAGLDETEAEKLFDCLSIDLLWPGPIEVDHWLCGSDVRVAHAPLQAALLALTLFNGEDLVKPGLVDDLISAGDQPEQAECLQAYFQFDRGQLSGHWSLPS